MSTELAIWLVIPTERSEHRSYFAIAKYTADKSAAFGIDVTVSAIATDAE